MTLTDTGPLDAVLDRDDSRHTASVEAAKCLPAGALLTTWCCFTEAMYLLGEVGGYRYQAELWKLRKAGRLVLHDLTATEIDRMAALMEKCSRWTATSESTAWLTGLCWNWFHSDIW